MAEPTRELQILLKLIADTSQSGKVSASLNQIQAQGKLVTAEMAATANAAAPIASHLDISTKQTAALTKAVTSGHVSVKTLSSLFYSLGTTVTTTAFAAYALYAAVKSIADEMSNLGKENAEMLEGLVKNSHEWAEMAKNAQSFADRAKLSEKIKTDLDKMAADLNAFRSKDLSGWQAWSDRLADLFGAINPFGGRFRDVQTAEAAASQRTYELAVRNSIRTLLNAKKATEDWAAAEADLPKGLADYQAKLTDAEAELARATEYAQTHQTPEALERLDNAIAKVNLLRDRYQQLGDETDKQNQKNKEFFGKQISANLRDAEAAMRNIHAQEQLIAANPFLSEDAKQAALLNLALREESALLKQIDVVTKDIEIAKAIGDPEKVAELRSRLQQLNDTLDLTKLKTTELSLPLQTELANWVNSFGTSAHQVAGIIEGSINAALEGTNQLLLDAAFRTGDWRQTIMGVERQIANMFLTWIEHMVMQFVLGETQKATATATQVSQAGVKLAAEAPVAAATSISSYGIAAVIGAALAIAAIAAIEGGFAEGGYTGGRRRRPAGIVHGEEYVFSAEEVDALGLPFLQRLASSASDGKGRVTIAKAGEIPIEPPNIVAPWVMRQPQGGSLSWGPDVTPPPSAIVPGPSGEPTVEIHPRGTGIVQGGGITVVPTFGNTPFGGSSQYSLYPTSWNLIPGLGWVPRAVPNTPNWGLAGGFNYSRPGGNADPGFGGGFIGGWGFGARAVAVERGGGFDDIGGGMAGGGRVPGFPSRIDNVLAALATGEVVISAPRVSAIDRSHPGLLDSLIHYADGGRVGSHTAEGRSMNLGDKIEIHVWRDEAEANRKWAQSSAGRKILRQLK